MSRTPYWQGTYDDTWAKGDSVVTADWQIVKW